ncbi:titin-like [Mercenaria mercenaria]|uniref:titin-like n=1 Tax=Mercenaria mercenaria TaxID=6596 RepID=UPI00234FAC35|nr:titin-like [Mercenaria mercenaria]
MQNNHETKRSQSWYSRISHNAITLSWRPPDQDGGKPISGYAVEYKEKNEKRWHKAGVCEADKNRIIVSSLQEDIEYVFRVAAINIVGNSKQLVGAKVRTKILEIPLSRRSSFQLQSSRDISRDSSRGRPSVGDALERDINQTSTDIEGDILRKKLEGLDPELEADPFVPKSDFFTYDETNSGNISNRHGDNKTRHSEFSPLPAPPSSDSNGKGKKRSGPTEIGAKRRHSDYSPLPKPKSRQYGNVRLRQLVESDIDSEDDGNNEDDFSMDEKGRNGVQVNNDRSITDFKGQDGVIRHQPTPSNIAYKHSRY